MRLSMQKTLWNPRFRIGTRSAYNPVASDAAEGVAGMKQAVAATMRRIFAIEVVNDSDGHAPWLPRERSRRSEPRPR